MAGLRSPSSRAIRCSASDGIFAPSACGSNVEMGANAASRFVPAGESHLDGLPVLHAVLCCVYSFDSCVCVPGVCSLYDLNLGTGVAGCTGPVRMMRSPPRAALWAALWAAGG